MTIATLKNKTIPLIYAGFNEEAKYIANLIINYLNLDPKILEYLAFIFVRYTNRPILIMNEATERERFLLYTLGYPAVKIIVEIRIDRWHLLDSYEKVNVILEALARLDFDENGEPIVLRQPDEKKLKEWSIILTDAMLREIAKNITGIEHYINGKEVRLVRRYKSFDIIIDLTKFNQQEIAEALSNIEYRYVKFDRNLKTLIVNTQSILDAKKLIDQLRGDNK